MNVDMSVDMNVDIKLELSGSSTDDADDSSDNEEDDSVVEGPPAIITQSNNSGTKVEQTQNLFSEDDQNFASLSHLSHARVEGAGMWKSWTRSFNKPIMAVLDLFDNAIDASLESYDPAKPEQTQPEGLTPTIVVQSDLTITKGTAASDNQSEDEEDSESEDDDEAPASRSRSRTNQRKKKTNDAMGLIMINSSRRPIPTMEHVLTVYRSSKQNDSDIGENGVGIKQACAHLSDVSIICTKSQFHEFGLGILSKELQREEPNLPSVQLPDGSMANGQSMANKTLLNLARQNPKTFGNAFESYGSTQENVDADYALEEGASMLSKVFEAITKHKQWKDQPNVFVILLCKLRHSSVSLSSSTKKSATFLLNELIQELPKRYLHIPKYFHVQIQNCRMEFQFWERRLADLTRFDVFYPKKTPLLQASNWDKLPDLFQEEDDSAEEQPAAPKGLTHVKKKNVSQIRVWCGFDPIRCTSEKSAPAALYLYSRSCGRLIKHWKDGRSEMNLIHSGSDFGQGLTIIIDDVHGTFPLNPTKQDVAFGLESKGEIHEENMHTWVGACANTYWKRYEDSVLTKTAILQLVAATHKNAKKLVNPRRAADRYPDIPMLMDGDFLSFGNLQWTLGKDGTIRCFKQNRAKAELLGGKDCCIRLPLKKVAKSIGKASLPKKVKSTKAAASANKQSSTSQKRKHEGEAVSPSKLTKTASNDAACVV